MHFSMLFQNRVDGGSTEQESSGAPDSFVALNLDRIVSSVTSGREEYNLRSFFHAPLSDVSAIGYRREVMRELEDGTVCAKIRSFAKKMRTMRQYIVQWDKLYYNFRKKDGSRTRSIYIAMPLISRRTGLHTLYQSRQKSRLTYDSLKERMIS
jgi:DNA mismatch repair protein MutS